MGALAHGRNLQLIIAPCWHINLSHTWFTWMRWPLLSEIRPYAMEPLVINCWMIMQYANCIPLLLNKWTNNIPTNSLILIPVKYPEEAYSFWGATSAVLEFVGCHWIGYQYNERHNNKLKVSCWLSIFWKWIDGSAPHPHREMDNNDS